MEQFIGTKVINAKPMNRADYNKFRGWELPADENGEDEGFLVEYTDGGKANVEGFAGYVSWSPKDVFEKAYRKTSGLTFGLAVEAMKRGEAVTRQGWNGKGMFLYYVPANSYQAQTITAKTYWKNKQEPLPEGASTDAIMVPYGAYIAMKTAQDNVVPWLASQTDVLAEDWCIVEIMHVDLKAAA